MMPLTFTVVAVLHKFVWQNSSKYTSWKLEVILMYIYDVYILYTFHFSHQNRQYPRSQYKDTNLPA